MQKFKIGIIGAGAIVETNHLPAIGILPNAEVGWIYDKNPARAGLVSGMYSIPGLKEEELTEGLQRVDCCLIATPYGVRKPYMAACKAAGTAMVVEKPYAFSRQEHLANGEGLQPWQTGVNLQRRYYQSVSTLRRIIQSRLFGDLRSVHFRQGNFTLKGGSGYLSDTTLSGGGVIAESAIHSLDILLWIMDASEVRVSGIKSLHKGVLDYDSVFQSEVRTPSGPVPVHCEITTLRNLDNGVRLQFDHAGVRCDLSPEGKIFVQAEGSGQLDFSLMAEPAGSAITETATRVNEAFVVFWQQFLSGLENKAPNMTSAASSLLTSSWIEGIYSTMRTS